MSVGKLVAGRFRLEALAGSGGMGAVLELARSWCG